MPFLEKSFSKLVQTFAWPIKLTLPWRGLNFVCCSKDESDWAESQVLKVSDCSRLVVSLGGNNNEAIHRTLSQSKAVLIFENIKELELSNFDISHTPTDSNKRGQIASIIFRCFQFSAF